MSENKPGQSNFIYYWSIAVKAFEQTLDDVGDFGSARYVQLVSLGAQAAEGAKNSGMDGVGDVFEGAGNSALIEGGAAVAGAAAASRLGFRTPVGQTAGKIVGVTCR